MSLPYKTLLFCACMAGCSGSSNKEAAGTSTSAREREIGTGSADTALASKETPKVACPRTGKWELCSVETRLVQSGFVVRRRPATESSARPGFSVKPVAYTLGRSRLEVFVYPDEASLARDVARIDTVTVAPRGSAGNWGLTPPTFVRSANLAAVFMSDNPTQVERLTLALTAGAPQR